MTFQWSVVAAILYGEIFITLILLLPWIRPGLWRRVFNSNIIQSITRFTSVAQYSTIVVLLLLFVDAVREVRKYANVDIAFEVPQPAGTDAVLHMRLFRAQRNLYISGFALLLFLVINRIVSLLLRSAYLSASHEAALRQAENANKTAQRLMESEGTDGALGELKEQNEKMKKELAQAEKDRDTMKTQAENLQKEYTRVCDELNKSIKSGADKKDD
ncbi:hypothetical protein FO519_001146 [Halicephalobus sp. NKZ332]|nr:hypothetical protein FO519_001146 [Halicephalobus sp. NKZ332]